MFLFSNKYTQHCSVAEMGMQSDKVIIRNESEFRVDRAAPLNEGGVGPYQISVGL